MNASRCPGCGVNIAFEFDAAGFPVFGRHWHTPRPITRKSRAELCLWSGRPVQAPLG